MNFPVKGLHSAGMFSRRHGLAVGFFLLVVVKLWLVHIEEIRV
jgi:hypothetical protein